MMSEKTIIILFMCCLVVIQGNQDRDNQPGYVYYPELNGWLKIHEPADWQEARITCHMEDALLAADWYPEMISTVNKLQASSNPPIQAVYAGAKVLLTLSDDGLYSYLKGEPILTALSGGRLKRSERCAVFNANATMDENSCTQKLHYVCFAPGPACGLENLGYEFCNETRHCYKVHNESKLWTDAFKVCRDEGGYLTIVNSDIEAAVISQLIQKYTINGFVSIGLYYWKLASFWMTVDGQTIDQAGYTNWLPGEPSTLNDPNSAFLLGYLQTDGKLYSHNRFMERQFICEKNPFLYNSENVEFF